MMRRLAAVVAAVALPMMITGPIALADDTLTEYLEQASAAEFHGEGIVMCTWGRDSAAARYDVTRSQGMTMATGPSGSTMISDGLTAIQSGSDWYGLEVEEWSAWSLSERYTVTNPVETTRLGRDALVVTVLEDGVERARLTIDSESTVPLVTEILDGSGSLYRLAVLVDFSPGVQPMPETMPDMHEMNTLTRSSDAGDLPAEAAGYRRADIYRSGPEVIQAFFTDGLFSFSVFEAERGDRPEVFDEATLFEVNGAEYRRIVMPSTVWIHWNAPDRTYVLVGDLPPDHLSEVLAELPEPGDRGLLVRMWRRLFG